MKTRIYTIIISVPHDYLEEGQTPEQDFEALKSGHLMVEELIDMKTYDDAIKINYGVRDV